ncbi:hypothetical protein RDABS01_012815 [Bienertia sinuspersici]
MDTSWIDLRNDDPAFYEGCKAFVELTKETSIEGNTRCPCNKCKLNKWFPLEEQDKHEEEMSLVQLYEDFHIRKDGSFIEGTNPQDFLDDAKAKANMLAAVDGSKS